MIEEIIKDADSRMHKSVDALKDELSKLRTGRAHPALLSHITVDYYGADVPLDQVASVSIVDSRMLSVTPWEKDMVAVVEKALMTSDLGINPTTSGSTIRIPLPPLTEERRRDLTKIVRVKAEDSRIAIRNIRRDANSDFKELLKEKEISEDDERGGIDRIQKITDNCVAQVASIGDDKEKDLMKI